MKSRKSIFLPVLLTILIACRSPANRVRDQRNEQCKGSFSSVNYTLTIPAEASSPPAIKINGEWFVSSGRYNAYRIHAKDLSRCLFKEECVRKWTEWERDCSELRVGVLESSLIPGIFSVRRSCELNQPVC